MSRTARVRDGFVSTLIRARARRRDRSRPPTPESMPAETTALLVMDVQNAIVERFGDTAALDRTVDAVATARAAGIRVIYVRVAFRPGHPEVSPRNRSFAALRDGGRLADDAATAIHPAVAPATSGVVLSKLHQADWLDVAEWRPRSRPVSAERARRSSPAQAER